MVAAKDGMDRLIARTRTGMTVLLLGRGIDRVWASTWVPARVVEAWAVAVADEAVSVGARGASFSRGRMMRHGSMSIAGSVV